MKFRVLRSTSCVILFLASCTWQRPDIGAEKKLVEGSSDVTLAPVKEKPVFSKEVRESFHFAASLERESLRLISKNNSFEAATLFSALSYGFEIASGVKKSPPRNIDCSRFQIVMVPTNTLKVYKVCQKPMTLLATIVMTSNENHFKITFHIKEWASVVGLSVTLTNPDIECEIQIKDKKLQELSCEDWAYFLSSSDASSTEVHLKTFMFNRNQQLQLKLQGGFYRDLIERKKIEIKVPLQGKIKLIEKEIEVKDDFAETPKPHEEAHGEKNKEKDEEYQKFIKTEEGVENQEGKNQNQGKEQGENQGQNAEENRQEVQNQETQAAHPEGQENNLEQQVQPEEIEQGESSGGVPKPNSRGTRGR